MRNKKFALGLLAGLSLLATSANAATYDFSFSGSDYSGSGMFTTSGSSSPFTVTGVTGTASSPFFNSGITSTITGVSGYYSADNLLFIPPTSGPSGSYYVDYYGISFSTADGDLFNLAYVPSEPGLEIWDGVIVASVNNPNGSYGDSPINLTVTATPLPSTWTMLIGGLVGLGFLACRGSKKSSAAPVAV